MFTGLVECLGTVRRAASDGAGGRDLWFHAAFATELTLGESVAVNGCCLTVTAHDPDGFSAQAGPETLARTNLGRLAAGDRVNLERAVRLGDRLGGHLVTGHVDALGSVVSREPSGEWEAVTFAIPAHLAGHLVDQGSVAVDGVSLTVVKAGADRFRVMLIPHTLAATTLGMRRPGDAVNLETDLIAKHVARLLGPHLPARGLLS